MSEIVFTDTAKWHWDRIFQCPECGGSYFGSSGIPAHTGFCHDQFGVGCKFKWDRANDKDVFVLKVIVSVELQESGE